VVPSSYHAFFSGAVSAAGALIGLLFVAISITPHKLDSTGFQIKAGLAFSVLINALVLSLYALLPGQNLAVAGLVLALAGVSSTLGLALLALRDPELRTRRVGLGLRFAGLLGLYGVQLLESLSLDSRPHASGPVSTDCTLVIVCFLIAIDRAWELLGAGDITVTKMVGRALGRRRREARASAAPVQPSSPAGLEPSAGAGAERE
jgi:hypothetical protein